MVKFLRYFGLALVAILFVACGEESSNKNLAKAPTLDIEKPEFNADSAYAYIQKQVDFGPRVPSSEGHAKCAEWLVSELEKHVEKVQVQGGKVTTYDGKIHELKNVIASINPKAKRRYLLAAHWDTRPMADKDKNPDLKDKPIDGANDGASGVGVLIEIARQLKGYELDFGVDFVLFDVEDYGNLVGGQAETWCLGSQYWSRNPHVPNYRANYGILLDMVGGKDAYFSKEGNSMYYASNTVNKVWKVAKYFGHGSYFGYERTDPIIDDHLFVNQIANIPMIDIIHYDRYSLSHFGSFWHTHDDNMNVIEKGSLLAVGQTVLGVILSERTKK